MCAVENVVQVLFCDPNARIGNARHRKSISGLKRDGHRTAGRRVFRCIVDKNEKRPPQGVRIAVDPNRSFGYLSREA